MATQRIKSGRLTCRGELFWHLARGSNSSKWEALCESIFRPICSDQTGSNGKNGENEMFQENFL